MKSKLTLVSLLTVCIGLIVLVGLSSGCGTTPSAPTRAEAMFMDISTNYVPKVVTVTNTVTQVIQVPATNTVTIYQTNQQNQLVTTVSNVVNQVFVTNQIPQVVTVTNMVLQYSGQLNDTAKGAASTAGAVVNTILPGVGSLVTIGLLGLGNLFQGYLNRKWSAQANSATVQSQVFSQAAGALTQIIETGREVLAKTPQGEQLANEFTAWMIKHQAATGTIQAVSQIVRSATNNAEAQQAAQAILDLMQQAQAPAQAPSK